MSHEVQSMFASIAPRYDLTNDALSMGVHRLWRRKAVKLANIQQGQTVVDLCCGTGDFASASSHAVGKTGQVVGIDFVLPMLELARDKQLPKLRGNGHDPIIYAQGDAMNTPLAGDFAEAVTIGFGIRNVDDPLACLKEMLRILKPGGTAAILEFGQPTLPGFSQVFTLYSKYLMPVIGGTLTGNRYAYHYLPETSKSFPAGETFLDLMKEAGFSDSRFHSFLSGLAYCYIGSK